MRWLFLALLAVHGLIHFMGFAKAFGLAELPQLSQPISKPAGVAWLVAGLALLATAALFLLAPGLWWAVGLPALLLSQVLVGLSWRDARFGTVANVLVLAGVAYGSAAQGPFGLRAQYRDAVRERLARAVTPPLLTEADLVPLPEPLRRYLRVTGCLGQPRVHHFEASWRGRIRATASDPWMPFTAEQYDFVAEPSRFFFMQAVKSGLPVDVFHAFVGGAASMRVRLLSLFPLVNARGPEVTRAETVTLFNDLCLLAPPALVDPSIAWEPIDARSVRGHYTVGSNTVSAVLRFDDAGELVDFVSEDRLAASPDGTRFVREPWSTPVRDYRSFGPRRLPSRGEARWRAPSGEFAYFEATLVGFEANPTRLR